MAWSGPGIARHRGDPLMRWSQIVNRTSPLVPIDPYYHWRLGAGARKDLRNPVRPVVIYLAKDKTAENLEAWADAVEPEPPLAVPSFYTRPPTGLEKTSWCTGLAKPRFFELLNTDHDL